MNTYSDIWQWVLKSLMTIFINALTKFHWQEELLTTTKWHVSVGGGRIPRGLLGLAGNSAQQMGWALLQLCSSDSTLVFMANFKIHKLLPEFEMKGLFLSHHDTVRKLMISLTGYLGGSASPLVFSEYFWGKIWWTYGQGYLMYIVHVGMNILFPTVRCLERRIHWQEVRSGHPSLIRCNW